MKREETFHWTPECMPDLSGRTALVTGANVGLGFHTARYLALRGARVIVAARNAQKGRRTVECLSKETPAGRLDFLHLDLSDLDSVRRGAEWVLQEHSRLDILVNNAGVMAPPRLETRQGFEIQFGVNHLGHFVLTARLWPLISSTAGSRVVNVSSSAAYIGRMNWDDLNSEKRYFRYGAYSQSKLANVLFSLELDRRMRTAGHDGQGNAAHPGLADTNLQKTTVALSGSLLEKVLYRALMPVLSQSADLGAWPQLRAATDPSADGASFWGPSRAGIAGNPVRVRLPGIATSDGHALRLWQVSQELTGEDFSI
jgi:protochlorophyllide reductase